MDTLPLPPRPSLDQYRKRAKSLVDVAQSDDPLALRVWASQWLTSLAAHLDTAPTGFVLRSLERAMERIIEHAVASRRQDNSFALANAQFLIAEAHGFKQWSDFARHVGDTGDTGDTGERETNFEAAADAIVGGDIDRLRELLQAHQSLIRERSRRVHHVTLLHYVAANGVEDFRQKTPGNIVAIARLLLDAGAAPDATADTYGGGTLQTTMNLLVSSTHPANAGVQAELVEVLLDYEAAINGVTDDESPIMTALHFGYVDAAETLARRGARIDVIVTAAALGRLDLVRDMIVDARTLKPGVPLVASPWITWPDDPRVHIELALVWACKFARTDVALFLLEMGVNPMAADTDHMTALHWAAASGAMRVVEELLRRGAALEVLNKWEGTVLDSTLHFALYIPRAGVDYVQVLDRLLSAGANVHVVQFPTGNASLDELFARYGR